MRNEFFQYNMQILKIESHFFIIVNQLLIDLNLKGGNLS